MRGYGSTMRVGGRMSGRWNKYNILVTNDPKVTDPNCSVATARGWNTAIHKI